MAKTVHPLFKTSTQEGKELFLSRRDAEKAGGVPFGMKKPTTKVDRDESWRSRIRQDREFAVQEWRRDKQSFRRRWEGKQ